MAVALSHRAEVDTSSAFRSVKEAVAMFGERLLVREMQLGVNAGADGDRRIVRESSSRRNAIATLNAKLEGVDGVKPLSLLIRESHSKLNTIANAKLEESSSKPSPKPMPASDDVPLYLVPSSPPFFASSPSLSLANDDDDDEEHGSKGGDLMVMTSIKKVEEEAAKARQEVVQLKKRVAELEFSMATLNAKLHRALSKLAHMEADKAAAERARIQQRDGGDMALTVWAERRAPRQPLGHLLSLGEADGEVLSNGQRRTAPATMRKVKKQKPIVPLVVPVINGMIFSRKKRNKDKESLYMKELYSLLRLS